MKQARKYNPLGRALVVLGLFGLFAGGCGNETSTAVSGSDGKLTPFQIKVPDDTAAVVILDKKGAVVKVIAFDDQGGADTPAECDIEGPNKCPSGISASAYPLEISQVERALDTASLKAKHLPSLHATGKCLFSYKINNKIYYYKEPCTP